MTKASRRAVSELLAVLVVLAIVVGVGIAVALLSSALVQRMNPSGVGLTIQSVRVYAISSDNRNVQADIVATVTGATSVTLTGVSIIPGTGTEVGGQLLAPQPPGAFAPGSTIQIQAKFTLSSALTPYTTVRVVVQFTDVAGKLYRVSGSALFEPYSA